MSAAGGSRSRGQPGPAACVLLAALGSGPAACEWPAGTVGMAAGADPPAREVVSAAGAPLSTTGAPPAEAIHAVVPLAPDTVLLLAEPEPYVRVYAVRPEGLALVAAAGSSGLGPGRFERPWRAAAIGGRVWIFDYGNYGGAGMVSVWRTAPLEEVERFPAPRHLVDLLPACGARPVAVYQARPARSRPEYGLAVREGGGWRRLAPNPPDTIPLTLSWEDSRATAVDDEVVFLGADAVLHHLPCDGGPARREPILDRRPPRLPAAHGAAFDGRTLTVLFADPRDRTATKAYLRAAGEPGGSIRALGGDIRHHGFHYGHHWLVMRRHGGLPELRRLRPEAIRGWLEDPASAPEDASP